MTEDEEIARSVGVYGWHAIAVTDCPPPFIYTCGLMTSFNHPEILLFGLEKDVAYPILAAVVEDVRGGRSFAMPGIFEGVLVGLPIAVRPVHPSWHEAYLGYAMGHSRFAGKPGGLVAVQLFWPDREGRFPFEGGCDPEVRHLQPELGLEARIA